VPVLDIIGRGDEKSSRDSWALVVSWLDAFVTACFFAALLWLNEKEMSEILEQDEQLCEAQDYSLRIKFLPHLRKGQTPDLEKLRKSLVKHFETLVNDNCDPVIPGRKRDGRCYVLDVNLGLNNQDTIRDMKVRGKMAYRLDLQIEKLFLMRIRGSHAHSDKEIENQARKVRRLKVDLVEICEKVRNQSKIIEARTAFVTFGSEEGYERARRAYEPSSFALYDYFCPKKGTLFKGKHRLEIVECQAPDDYIW